jgi:L-lactate dehydrogenase
LAAGIPTSGEPVLLDISSSITTLNSAKQLVARGEKFPALWAMDAKGQPTDDPAAVIGGGGSLLPTGGMDHGHKGYAMAILAEALTQGLSGYGRVDAPKSATVSIYLQVTDPAAFAGHDAFVRQTDWLVNACQSNPPRPGVSQVRLPGQHALLRQRAAHAQGVPLIDAVMDTLRPLAAQVGLNLPQEIVV